jgi:hypothetical protein
MFDGIDKVNWYPFEVVWGSAFSIEICEGIAFGKLFKFEHSQFALFHVVVSCVKLFSMSKGRRDLESVLVLWGGSEGSQLGLVSHTKHLLLFLWYRFRSFPSFSFKKVVLASIDHAGDGVVSGDG